MNTIAETLAAVHPAAPVRFRNLAMHPLVGVVTGEPGYLVLDEAITARVARVTEISDHGAVPELAFENDGDRAVLLLDGEELVGAKQNRVLNLTILAPPGERIVIPVSCVEAGRWHDVSEEFSASPRAQYAAGRARKARQVSASMRETGARRADQGAVWDDIEDKSLRMEVHSATAAMEALFTDHGATIDEYVAAMPPLDGQVGAVFEVDGRLAGVDLFDHPGTLAKLLPKLVRSYALDAIDEAAAGRESEPADGAGTNDVVALLERIGQARAEHFPALGEGFDLRFEAPGLSGGALAAGERVVHLFAFVEPQATGRGRPRMQTRMVRASRRRRGH